jgi:hypothetical protein
MEFENGTGPEADFISYKGNVIFQHYNLLFKCDSAEYSRKSNILVGDGNIQILEMTVCYFLLYISLTSEMTLK